MLNTWPTSLSVSTLFAALSLPLQNDLSVAAVWHNLRTAVRDENVISITVVIVALSMLLLLRVPAQRPRVRTAWALFGSSLLLLVLASVLTAMGLLSGAQATYWTALFLGSIALVNLTSLAVFDVALNLVHVSTPRILRDLLVACAYIGAAFVLLARHGVSFSGIITTSAVLTAILGFSMQDTLGNIMGGLALQLEKTISMDDWIQVDQLVGKVKEIRWRHTAIETRDWDTVVIPNSMLMKGRVVVWGRRIGEPVQHRRWVWFNVGFQATPTEVITAVDEALQAEPLFNVARAPKAHCILMDFKESYCRYAARYWLTDLAVDDPTDSLVRTRIYFALKRASISLALPAQNVFITEDSEARREMQQQQNIAHRLQALAKAELFHTLNEAECLAIAQRLQPAPFTKGEAILRQGEEGHRLYLIITGSARIDIATPGIPRKTIARLQAGDFFGEMSLMTGEKRSATVIALEDAECYRLDKEAFHDILHQRPEIAEHISHVLARRSLELQAARDGLDAEAHLRNMHHHTQRDIFARILDFFGVHDS